MGRMARLQTHGVTKRDQEEKSEFRKLLKAHVDAFYYNRLAPKAPRKPRQTGGA